MRTYFFANLGATSPQENSKFSPSGRPSFQAPKCWLSVTRSPRAFALDALQLAVALELRHQKLVDDFVAADTILCEIAALEGFSVINPEHS